MGFLSVLGKIGKGALNIGTGGVAGTIMDAFGGAGQVLGGQQGGANNARVAQGQLNQGYDRNAIDLYSRQQGAQDNAAQLDLQRKGYETGNRSATAKQALIGALLSGGMDRTSLSGGKASGGLFQALQQNPDAMAAMRNLHGQADKAQMLPVQYTGGEMLQAPKLSEPTKIDIGGGKLGTLSKIMQVLGAFGGGGRPEEEEGQ